MKIKKVYNNNVVLTEKDTEKEMVVMGCGIAFQKKVGDEIDSSKIEKTFVLENHSISDKLAELLREVPEQYLSLSDKIISLAKSMLPNKLDDYLYVALTDHLHFAITRHNQGIQLRNVLLWEIKKFYKQEFFIAQQALKIIENETGIALEEDEAGSIAMHLVNSQMSGKGLESLVVITKLVNHVLNIVKFHFQMDLDETSVNYERFLTHLRFFALRMARNEQKEDEKVDEFLFEQVQRKYHEAYQCSMKIATYMEKSYNWSISKDELIYLTIHIHRVANRHRWQQANSQ
ncbi:MAG: BglG family transcription antiterminator LicT [Bacillus sp. (in: firmicutes)]